MEQPKKITQQSYIGRALVPISIAAGITVWYVLGFSHPRGSHAAMLCGVALGGTFPLLVIRPRKPLASSEALRPAALLARVAIWTGIAFFLPMILFITLDRGDLAMPYLIGTAVGLYLVAATLRLRQSRRADTGDADDTRKGR